MKTLLTALVSSILLAGCMTTKTPQQSALDNKILAAANATPICKTEEQCDAMWARAVYFVTKYAGLKIQIQTDVLIQTYNSTDTRIAMGVNKIPDDDGYQIQLTYLECDNIFLSCYYWDLRESFDDNDRILGGFNIYITTGDDVLSYYY